ncbi:hypothetical protein [Diaphorobacter sp.]|uniref:hypothetical protein n=1 Tax=Diaphorobacter sp. TaxID=1934310 RepID=UPI002587C943|nr:hypothetical protein [Diaphorobacter sp.]
MAVVVDPPLFISLFKESDPKHERFVRIKDWVVNGPAKFVYGGTTYKSELAKVGSVLAVLKVLEQKGKIHKLSDVSVDLDEFDVKNIEPKADFDDPHLVAIIRVSGVRIVCVDDPRSHKYLKSAKFYQSSKSRPKLFTNEKNINLLNKRALCGSCY